MTFDHQNTPLSAEQARVLATLMEKQRTVPDSYPLTLNSLLSGCNQKTSREPLMQLSEAEALAALDALRERHLVIEVSGQRAMRWEHNFERVLAVPSQSAALLGLLRETIMRAPDRIAAAQRWLPVIVALVVPVMLLLALTAMGLSAGWCLGIAGLGAAASWAAARARIRAELARSTPAARKLLNRLFGPPLVLGAVMMGFAHGANDVANVVAPLSVIAHASADWAPAGPATSGVALAIGGGGIALGALLFGRRLVRMIGSRITRLNTGRALCVSFATALTVFGASRLGLPVSTTHVAVGGVFGVGFYREWEDRYLRPASQIRGMRDALPDEGRRRLVRRSALVRTLAAWAVTVPATGTLAAAIALLIG